uniref:N-acylneuraminate cytidylyltransferase n=1 Tax=Haptolina ericina TaxID=156174 RepID=A0A7S3B0V2_9EUKA|mmetsp:Transcript_45950/g.103525  ORF Transcript_45950/g.103525 Transcript_45950/m.103525 type:complete len:238 (+) Transcript_45950:43-756(+)
MADANLRVIAVIPARGGSVSIPKKNIKPLLGRPLIDWVIAPALNSGIFTEVWVSTDDDTIEQSALESGARVHRRAAETATATASTESAMKDFIDVHPDFDVLCLIQATSPLIVPDDFTKGISLLRKQNADSLVTAVRAHRFLWHVDSDTGEAKANNYDPTKRPRRQDWDGELIENGAFYFTRKATWEKYGCRLGGKIALYEMAEHTLTELDSLVDWEIVTHMVADYGFWPPGKSKPA